MVCDCLKLKVHILWEDEQIGYGGPIIPTVSTGLRALLLNLCMRVKHKRLAQNQLQHQSQARGCQPCPLLGTALTIFTLAVKCRLNCNIPPVKAYVFSILTLVTREGRENTEVFLSHTVRNIKCCMV